MTTDKVKIGVVAPASRLEETTAKRVAEFTQAEFAGRVELVFHPQCFLSSGHFAGPDAARADAVLDIAKDDGFAAVWFARGGYGSGRIAQSVIDGLGDGAKKKGFFGYSDGG